MLQHRTHVLWAHWSDMPAGWPIKEHVHAFFHLFYTVSGTGVLMIDHKPYQMQSGALLIVPPDTPHEMPADAHTLVTFYEVKFAIDDPHVLSSVRRQGIIAREHQNHLEPLLQYITLNWGRNVPAAEEDIDCFLSSLLLSTAIEKDIPNQSTYILTDGYNELTRQIISYVDQNHTEPFRLEAMAEALGRNPNYLCSVFKKATGITIIDYLNYVRVRHATYCFFYAAIPAVPVSTLCQYVGFSNTSHFNRVFRALTGISPGKFRKLYAGVGSEETGASAVPNALSRYYDETLSIKIQPLQESIASLKNLGEFAKTGHI